jgi:hypothetical protein
MPLLWQIYRTMNSGASNFAGLHLLAQRQPDHTHDIASDIIQPDIVVPDQWSAAFRRRQRSGETKLLAGVLISAWNDLDSLHKRVRLEAMFFFEMADAGEPISLRFLCEAFELELSGVQQLARHRIERTCHKVGPLSQPSPRSTCRYRRIESARRPTGSRSDCR